MGNHISRLVTLPLQLIPCHAQLAKQLLPRYGLEVFQPWDNWLRQALAQLMGKKGRDAAFFIRKWLKDALRQEKIQPPVRSKMGSITAAELSAYTEALIRAGKILLYHTCGACRLTCNAGKILKLCQIVVYIIKCLGFLRRPIF